MWFPIYFIIVSFEEKAMAPHSSTLAWKIPWTEEPGGLQSMGSQRVGHNWVTSLSLFTFMHWRRTWQPSPMFLPGESQGWEPGGLPSMGSHRVGHEWRDLAAAAAVSFERQNFIVWWNQIYHCFQYSLCFFFIFKNFFMKRNFTQDFLPYFLLEIL